MFDKISVSCRTIIRHVEEIAADIEGTLTENIRGFDLFSGEVIKICEVNLQCEM